MFKLSSFEILLLAFLISGQINSQWVQTYGPPGGTVKAILIINDSTLLVGTSENGIYVSTNAGGTWFPANEGITSTRITAFATINENIYTATFGGGIFQSTNSGSSWIERNNGIPFHETYINALVSKDQNLFAATDHYKVIRSTNFGENWDQVSDSKMPNIIEAIAADTANIFAGTYGVYSSSTDGDTWNLIFENKFVISLLAVNNKLFAGTRSYGVYSLTFDGIKWNPSEAGLPGKYIYSLANFKTNIFAGTTKGIYYSTNDGVNWNYTTNILSNNYVYILSDYKTKFYAGTDNGLFISVNGINWNSTGLGSPKVNTLYSKDSLLYAGTSTGLWKLSNNGIKWFPINKDLTNVDIHAITSIGTNLFAGTSDGIFISTDNGNSWFERNSGIEDHSIESFGVINSTILAGTTDSGIFLSTDQGISWTAKNNGFIPGKVRKIIVKDSSLFITFYASIYRSTDLGENWNRINGNFLNGSNSSLCFIGQDLVASSYSYDIESGGNVGDVFFSSDNGENWIPYKNGKCFSEIYSAGSFLLGTSGSIDLSISYDKGETWESVNPGYSVYTYSFAFNSESAFIGTNSGVWQRPISELTSAEEIFKENISKEYLLKQNYPNPFNPTTAIEFYIPQVSLVNIKIYDLLGNEVAELTNEEISAGRHIITFDASGLSSGIYFYQLKAGNYIQAKKMMVLK